MGIDVMKNDLIDVAEKSVPSSDSSRVRQLWRQYEKPIAKA